ncbi:MAG TPA: cytochrome c3 family protein [Longimicrobiales bacterium]|nr:cytochrome c3 family protein [Longimicrobiales bacterium]
MIRRLPILLLVIASLAAAGCDEDRIVFRDRDLLEGLPANAAGFVGYSDNETKLTVCGNCHVTQQNQWEATAHANAFAAAAAAAPAIADACAACHGTSEIGNDTEAAGGFAAVRDPRYHDVQCESCHGPGENHVRNPDGGTVSSMLARVNAGPDMNGTCAECHSGAHHPYVEEWEVSGHGTVIASPAGNPSCQGCHEGKAALAAMGVQSEYRERGTTGHIAITCAVCHDPHRARNDGQLRFAIDVPNEAENLCMRCHHKRGGPEPTGNRGPHSPEGPMLLGEAGWWPPNMLIEPGTRIIGTHGSEANPRMCAGCHMHKIDAVDEVTGQLTIPTTGHLFEAIPCLDASGLPTRDDNCTIDQRTFRTCTSGCHGSEAAARSALLTVRQRIATWNNQLKAQLAQVPATESNPNDNRYTTAEGARFNSQLADRPGSVVHNPFLLEALLIASIQQIQREYGIAPSTTIDYTTELKRVLQASQLIAAK